MQGALAGHIDVAQVVLYVFWAFFAGLILYLRREDKREGYPLVSNVAGPIEGASRGGFPPIPTPKIFRHYHGGTVFAPSTTTTEAVVEAVAAAPFAGAPIEPVGNPLLAGVGPGAWCLRDEVPDLTWTGEIKVKPLRMSPTLRLHPLAPNPIGWSVVGADGRVAGHVADLWVDEVEEAVQFLEVEVGAVRTVLVPMPFAKLRRRAREVRVRAITSLQFEGIPLHANEGFVTRREEDRILGYFGAGLMYAVPGRAEPLI